MQDEFLPKQDPGKRPDKSSMDTIAGLFIIAGVGVLAIGGIFLPRSLAVMGGDGVHGTYTVVNATPRCNKSSCELRGGTFRSDDGRVVRTGAEVGVERNLPVREGETIRAFAVNDSSRVYSEYDRKDAHEPLIFMGTGGLLFPLLGGLHFWKSWREKKRPGA